jgi:hypothetical protein
VHGVWNRGRGVLRGEHVRRRRLLYQQRQRRNLYGLRLGVPGVRRHVHERELRCGRRNLRRRRTSVLRRHPVHGFGHHLPERDVHAMRRRWANVLRSSHVHGGGQRLRERDVHGVRRRGRAVLRG